MGRYIPLLLLVPAWQSCIWEQYINSYYFGKRMPIKSELTYPKHNYMFDNMPLCYMWKRVVVFCSKLHRLLLTFLGLICCVGVMDSC
jgi:hypothetical protein